MSSRMLITGVTGFVGGSLARRFSAQGYQVTGLIRRETRGLPCPLRISGYAVEELASLIAELRPQTIVHAAGSASVGLSISQPSRDYNDSVALFQRLLEATRLSGQRPRLVFLSSAAVYGNPAVLPVPESHPLAPISPYGYHKVLGETLAREYASCFGIPVLILRLFSLFGPAQKRLLLWEIFEQFKSRDQVVLQGSGLESRDYLHIDDLADRLAALLPCLGKEPLTVNVASGRSVTVSGVARCIAGILGSEKEISFKGLSRPGDPRFWQADVSLLEGLVGQQAADFEQRLRGTIEKWLA